MLWFFWVLNFFAWLFCYLLWRTCSFLFTEIVKIADAQLFLYNWCWLGQLSHIQSGFSTEYWKGSNLRVCSHNWAIQNDWALAYDHSLTDDAIFPYFYVVPHFHRLNDCILIYENVVSNLHWNEFHLVVLLFDRWLYNHILTESYISANQYFAQISSENETIHEDHMIEYLNVVRVFNQTVLAN